MTCEVSRAPLVPSGSLTTWTRISWPSLQQVLDLRLRPRAIPASRRRPSPFGAASPFSSSSSRLELLELLERVDDVGDVEEAVALEAEVDERRLHAGQDLRDPALVDVADDAALPLALDEDFGDEVVFENGHHGFVAVRGDDHLLGHSRTPRGFRLSGCRLSGCRTLTSSLKPGARSPIAAV